MSMTSQVPKKRKLSVAQVILHVVICVLLFLSLYPIYMMLIKSVKTIDQEIHTGFQISFPFHFQNYAMAWELVNSYILNTFLIAIVTTLGILLVCSCMAYGFTRYEFWGKNVLFMMVLAIMMIPSILTIIPQYSMVKEFNMVNKRIGVILPSIAGAIPMGMLLLNTFFNGLPQGLFEAADLDGASGFSKYYMIALPLSLPIMATLGLTSFLNAWNDLIWPQLILRKDELQTISVAMNSFTTNYYKTTHSYAVPLAGYVIVSLPLILVFSFTAKQFMEGLTSGAFKM
ncbi:MAG: carbohydrate ABC transporter permease [Clostridia bacterium]|nr:carbohydrate ABC transporter permease [Clostridia bacterium]